GLEPFPFEPLALEPLAAPLTVEPGGSRRNRTALGRRRGLAKLIVAHRQPNLTLADRGNQAVARDVFFREQPAFLDHERLIGKCGNLPQIFAVRAPYPHALADFLPLHVVPPRRPRMSAAYENSSSAARSITT